MKVSVIAASSWTHAGRDADPRGLPMVRAGALLAVPDLPRPDRHPPGNWRRMSRLARLTAIAAEPLLPLVSSDAGVILGLFGGEFGSGVEFLRSFFVKGAAASSPLAFQNTVHNAPLAHLSIATGMRGHSETIFGGGQTMWRAVERAMTRVVVYGEQVLVLVADDLGPEVRAGLTFAGEPTHWGEAAGALLIGPVAPGLPAITLHDGTAPPNAWGRAAAYMDEATPPTPAFAWDHRLGLGPGAESAALVALLQHGGAMAGAGLWLEVT